MVVFVEASPCGKRFNEIAQTIELDGSRVGGRKGMSPSFGAPNWLVDQERGFIWIFSARKHYCGEVTKHTMGKPVCSATKFHHIPSLSEGAKVRLDEHSRSGGCSPYGVWFTHNGLYA